MNRRSLLFHACLMGCAVAFWLQAPAAEPVLQLRWLETDPKTGDSLLSAIKAKSLEEEAANNEDEDTKEPPPRPGVTFEWDPGECLHL